MSLKVLFAASEAAPFAKSGGLGDVAAALPKALQEQGAEVRLIVPKYNDIADEFQDRMQLVSVFSVALGWRNQYCSVKSLREDGVVVYFIENEYYFNRDRLYGYEDDPERFAFFSRAVVEALPLLRFVPDIVHCHDWHTALIPVLLKDAIRKQWIERPPGTVLTVHNLQYQGCCRLEELKDWSGLDDSFFTLVGLEFYGGANLLKGGLVFADQITTVSPTYAEEIRTPYFGEGLDGVLRSRSRQLTGIVNGLDESRFDPERDPYLYANYKDALADKRKNKLAFQRDLGFAVSGDTPLIGMVSRLVEHKGFDLMVRVFGELMALDVQWVLLGQGQPEYESFFRQAAARYPGKFAARFSFNEVLSRKIYAASDLFLMPSRFEPCGIGQLLAMKYLTVPIVRDTGGLRDTVHPYDAASGTGTGFVFHNFNAGEMRDAIRQAVDMYRDEAQWSRLIHNLSVQDFSWAASARKYMEVYALAMAGAGE